MCSPCSECATTLFTKGKKCPPRCFVVPTSTSVTTTSTTASTATVTAPAVTDKTCDSDDTCPLQEFCSPDSTCIECSMCHELDVGRRSDGSCPTKCSSDTTTSRTSTTTTTTASLPTIVQCRRHSKCGQTEYCSGQSICEPCSKCVAGVNSGSQNREINCPPRCYVTEAPSTTTVSKTMDVLVTTSNIATVKPKSCKWHRHCSSSRFCLDKICQPCSQCSAGMTCPSKCKSVGPVPDATTTSDSHASTSSSMASTSTRTDADVLTTTISQEVTKCSTHRVCLRKIGDTSYCRNDFTCQNCGGCHCGDGVNGKCPVRCRIVPNIPCVGKTQVTVPSTQATPSSGVTDTQTDVSCLTHKNCLAKVGKAFYCKSDNTCRHCQSCHCGHSVNGVSTEMSRVPMDFLRCC